MTKQNKEQIISLLFANFNYDDEIKELRKRERKCNKNTKEFEYHLKRLGKLI